MPSGTAFCRTWPIRQHSRSTAHHLSPPRTACSGVVVHVQVWLDGVRRTCGGRPRPTVIVFAPLVFLPLPLDSFVDLIRLVLRSVRCARWLCRPDACYVRVRGVSGLFVGRLTRRLGFLGHDGCVVDLVVLPSSSAASLSPLLPDPAHVVFACTTCFVPRYVAVSTLLASRSP
jgi:hypothetical protein